MGFVFAFILGLIVATIAFYVFRELDPENDVKEATISASGLLSSNQYPFTWSRQSPKPAKFVVLGVVDGKDVDSESGELNLSIRRQGIVTPKVV